VIPGGEGRSITNPPYLGKKREVGNILVGGRGKRWGQCLLGRGKALNENT